LSLVLVEVLFHPVGLSIHARAGGEDFLLNLSLIVGLLIRLSPAGGAFF